MTNAEIISIKEYIDMRFHETEKAHQNEQIALNHRLEVMNQIRNQLNDQAHTFLTRAEYEAKHEAIANKISDLETFKAVVNSKANQSAVFIAYLFSAASMIISLIALFKDFAK
jgi:SUMO ligase MMS21 Smc5/6 complex component